ncbi:uncharacterized protein LOC111691919 [Anoplophora glabripennis]|uniref:uncharacterized protein LOC111691919 n=1 Tax=Anoplophora glabripennis TaxID=217634 RepID=UPI000C766370|nr:uncharacterized protein LOC111691919 [Anoplophora glabripennis]
MDGTMPIMHITGQTHSLVVDESGNNITVDDVNGVKTVLLYSNNDKEVITVPLTEGIAKEFVLLEVRRDGTNPRGTEEITSQTIQESREDCEQIKIWTTNNTLYLIECVEKFDKEFSSGIKKNVWQRVAELLI